MAFSITCDDFKRILRSIHAFLKVWGIDLAQLCRSMRSFPFFLKDYFILKKQLIDNQSPFRIQRFHICLHNRFTQSGNISDHYFHQDLLIANKIFLDNPVKHVDVGSRIDGFVAHVASFRKIEVFDVRDLDVEVPNIIFKRADFMCDDMNLYDYCDSISSLHALEHFGLGRYGDKIDANGYIKGLNNIYKMLKGRGKFYFSVPIGSQRIEFNAHRVFSLRYLIGLFKDKYNINTFSYVNDEGKLFIDIDLDQKGIDSNYSCNYGCGIFELTKK